MIPDAISRIRRFNRAVTRETGALDQSFLGRGRPLGPARVLHAIGQKGGELETIRTYLGLEKTLLSRFLKSLQQEGLIEMRTSQEDGRRRIATLTATGKTEVDAYNALSNERAQSLLDRHVSSEAILQAMDLVASALGRDDIVLEECDPRSEAAIECLQAYYEELGQRFDTGFDVNLSRDPEATDMIRPRGTFIVAVSDGLPLGCVGLKGNGGSVAEIKRLWVSPASRGLGLARKLMSHVEDTARTLNIQTLRLDTNSALPEAVSLYERSGWTEIDRFNDDPYPDRFFEKQL